MSIIYQIPHNAYLQNCQAVIPATFAAGVFTLSTTPVDLIAIKPNAIYLIDRVSISASIPESDWQASLMSAIPQMQVSTKLHGNIYPRPYSLGIYKQDASFSGWYKTDSHNDVMQLKASGAINQIANTVGITTINVVIAFDIYEITNTAFQIAFRDIVSGNSGQQVRGN